MRRDAPAVAGCLLLFVAGAAWGYPQYIVKGYAQCGGCHYSPTGGGPTTAMGQSSVEALVPDLLSLRPVSRLRGALTRPDLTGRDEDDNSALQADAALDTRLLFLRTPRVVGAEPSWLFIPMLLEGGGIAAFGPVSLYATATVRKRSTAEHTYTAMSREHWLSWEVDYSLRFRAGRMVLPFGLRFPDHTLYTREDFGFDKFDQSYAVAVDYAGDALEVHAAAFAGDLWLDPPALQERGGAVTVAHAFWDDRLSLGASALFGLSRTTLRPAVSVFLRSKLWGPTYVVGELAGQRLQERATGQAQAAGAGVLRVGYLPHPSTDIFVELSGRAIEGPRELIKLRYQFGLNTHLLPWVELSPAFILEETVETGLEGAAMVQLHVFY